MKQFIVEGLLLGEPLKVISTEKGCEHFVSITENYFDLSKDNIKELDDEDLLKYWSL